MQFIHKTAEIIKKSLKRSYYSASCYHSGDVMVGNIGVIMNSLFRRQSPSHPPDSAPDSKRITRRYIVFFDCVIFIHHDCVIFFVFVRHCFISNTAYVSLGKLIQNNNLFVDKCSIYALASTLRVYCTKSTPEIILYAIFSTTNV